VSAPSRIDAMLGPAVDLLSIDTSTPRPWTPGAKRIMRPGLRSIWFGSRGQGKSLAAMIIATQVIEGDGSVAYADWENGPRRQAERLETILEDRPDTTRAAVAQRLDYRPAVRLGKLADAKAVAEWAALFAGRDLVIVDSATRALGQLALDENAAGDVAAFMTRYIDPIAEQGTAVLLLDNTGHEERDRTRGSSAKLDLCELAYRVTSQAIAPDRAGTITLDRVRTRDGDEARQLVAHVGEGSYSTIHQPEQSERQAAVVEAILAYLEEHPGSTTEEVAKGVGIRKAECRSQLADLETPGTGSGTVSQCPSQVRDRRGTPHTRKGWYLASQSQLTTVPQNGTGRDRQPAALTGGPGPPSLKDGTGTASAQQERAERVASRASEEGSG
jgi:AAA domain